MTGTRIRDSEHVERCLDAAVLTVFAVQGDKDYVSCCAELEDVFTEQRGALPLSGLSHSFQIRRLSVKGILRNLGKVPEEGLRIKPFGFVFLIIKAHIQIRQDRPVSFGAERAAYTGTRQERNIPLSAESSAQNNDF